MQTLISSEYRYRKIMRSIAFTLLIFLGLLNLSSLILSGIQVLLSLAGTDSVTANVGYQLFYAVAYLTSFMLPVVFLKKMIRKAGFSYQPMRADPKITPWLPLILFAGVSAVLAAAYLNAIIVDLFPFFNYGQAVQQAESKREWYSVVLEFLVVCLVPAVCEEFLFRGAILTNLLPFGRANAILTSALLFGLMHQNFQQFFYAFCGGVVLGVLYERTGSIWGCMLLHLTNNFFSTFEVEFSNAFSKQFSPVAVTVLEILLFAIGLVSAVILIFRFAPQKQVFGEGIFGKPVPTDDAYFEYPISAKQRIKGFFNVPMIIFLVLVAIEAVVYLLLPAFYV